MVGIFGILNLTRDSFSDGGRHLAQDRALAHAERLLQAGADVIDVGAESTHPDAEDVSAELELSRLVPVVDALLARGVAVSIDTRKPEVMAAMATRGVAWLNDVDGFRTPASLAAAANAPRPVRFVVMFHRNAGSRAERRDLGTDGLLADFEAFVQERRAAFAAVGVTPSRLVFDPGMGFFLGRTALPSLHVLRHLPRLCAGCGPLLVSVSRKSFLGEVTGRPVAERAAATLAAELWAARAGVAYVRTHDPAALRDGLSVEAAIRAIP